MNNKGETMKLINEIYKYRKKLNYKLEKKHRGLISFSIEHNYSYINDSYKNKSKEKDLRDIQKIKAQIKSVDVVIKILKNSMEKKNE